VRGPYNVREWESELAIREARLRAVLADRTPVDACDIDLVFRAENDARRQVSDAESELYWAKSRSAFRMRNWDETVDEGWYLGSDGTVATVRYKDGQVQTMDRAHFWASLLP
jgi:hypothetical protein